jgi:hypothetical protein
MGRGLHVLNRSLEGITIGGQPFRYGNIENPDSEKVAACSECALVETIEK